ncbi:hypothetical protein K491DRAFT_258384 [Lophiostoma macrostomum CBS 122681]|uniref:Uncharacterized protein n=1 Tax=Lophiostoma macrostomum CBS 122681 TaxID=1314788 RepID=A0A6A6TGM1_9PLEO|nr:hypothetical protein K491DRAFT_258384 [Lophiostoma macrostomum CBS 122681]
MLWLSVISVNYFRRLRDLRALSELTMAYTLGRNWKYRTSPGSRTSVGSFIAHLLREYDQHAPNGSHSHMQLLEDWVRVPSSRFPNLTVSPHSLGTRGPPNNRGFSAHARLSRCHTHMSDTARSEPTPVRRPPAQVFRLNPSDQDDLQILLLALNASVRFWC